MLLSPSQGIPYPEKTDYAALPLHLQGLLNNRDAKIPTWDAGFLAMSKAPSAMMRSTVTQTGISPLPTSVQILFDSVVFSNAGITADTTADTLVQDSADVPSWWLVGCFIALANGGTVTANTLNKLRIQPVYPALGSALKPGPAPSSVIIVTPPSPLGAIYSESVETNNGGEAVQAVGIVKLFGGASIKAMFAFNDPGAAATRTIAAGAALWATRLGNA